MMNRLSILIITILLTIFKSSGQHAHYSYTQLSISNGLSHASIESILLDKQGDLWIGTKNGLNQYAQQKMNNFFHMAGNKFSIPDNHILHLAEDSIGNIWIATAKGLAQYDREQNIFRTITRGRVQSSLCIDGGILFGGDNVLYFYDYIKQKLEQRIHIQPEGPNTLPIQFRVQKIIPIDKNRVMIGTRRKGIFIYHHKTGVFEPFTSDIPNALLIAICKTSDQQVYASFYTKGVHVYDKTGKKQCTYTTENSALNNNYVMDILQHKGKIWLATDGGGINIIDPKTRNISHLLHTTGDLTSLPVNSITQFYKDQNENLWIGSVRGGVINIKESYIKTYQDVVLNYSGGLTEKSVTSLYEDKQNNLVWIGTDGGGINLYNPQTEKFTHYPATYGDKVVSITGFSENELLISLYMKGLFIFNKQTGKYKRFIVVDEKTNRKVCFNGYIALANQINDEKIYIIGFGGWVYHLKKQKFTPLTLPDKYKEVSSALQLTYVNQEFSLLKQGNLAYIAHTSNDSIHLLTETNIDESITSMTYDSIQHTVWIGTNHGLRYYNMEEKKYKELPTGLFFHISYLTIDQQNRLWISAHNKLFSYSIQENKFTSWNNSDGFLSNEILAKYHNTQNKDFIYLAGTQGLVRIACNIYPEKHEEPTIYLSDIHYNGQSCLKQIQNGKLSIPWNYQSLRLNCGVKSKDVFQKHLLKYTIKDPTSENTFESYETYLNLSSLSPGNYTLLVSCYTKEGTESQGVQLLTLTITPPWYKSTWFIASLTLTFIGGCIIVGKWTYRKKTRQMKGDIGNFLQGILYSLNSKERKEELSQETEIPKSLSTLNEADKVFLDKLNKLINENLSNEELSIKFLTDHLAMSRASLYNKVKALTGIGVNDYINRIRIEHSVYLLTHTDMSINEISCEVGFSYPRYFSTSFKQVKGMPPTQFKEENKKNNIH